MTDIVIVWDKLDDLFISMNEVGTQSDEISTYFRTHVCSEAGFIGVLTPLAQAMPKIANWFDGMDDLFDQRWAGVANAIEQSARDLDSVDESITIDLDALRGQGPSGDGNNPPITVDLPRLIPLSPVSGDLVAPEKGDNQLNHNKKFEWVADAWDTGVEVINDGIDFLRWIGFDVENIPVTSLRDHVVYPLSGDWGAIQANANACDICEKGMKTWGNNFSLLSANVVAVMLGQTSARLVGHINLYNLAARGMGAGIGAGSIVFDEIAEVCERIGKEVEDALVWLGEKVVKLLTKIGTRCIPLLGQAILIIEILWKGKEAFTDIWDDIVACFNTVKDLMELVDEVKAWAEAQADRLDTFQQILDAAKELPVVGESQGIDALSESVTQVETTLNDIADFGEGSTSEGDAVDDRLDGIEDRQNPPPDEDTQILAPGPLDAPPGNPTGTETYTA